MNILRKGNGKTKHRDKKTDTAILGETETEGLYQVHQVHYQKTQRNLQAASFRQSAVPTRKTSDTTNTLLFLTSVGKEHIAWKGDRKH